MAHQPLESVASQATAKMIMTFQGHSQKKIERGPNFASFNVTSFTYNGIVPFVNYARRYYKNCCTKLVNVIYEPCHWFTGSCFCAFSKVAVNVLGVIVVRKLSPSKLLCLPPHLIDCHL